MKWYTVQSRYILYEDEFGLIGIRNVTKLMSANSKRQAISKTMKLEKRLGFEKTELTSKGNTIKILFCGINQVEELGHTLKNGMEVEFTSLIFDATKDDFIPIPASKLEIELEWMSYSSDWGYRPL